MTAPDLSASVTPEDAVTRRLCPLMLQYIENRTPSPDHYCYGDRCQAWRWSPLSDGPNSIRREPIRRGYCGLGGPDSGSQQP